MSRRRAIRPVDPDAARAADEAIASETGGRPLTMGDNDEALREKWMDAYVANGGKVRGAKAKPAGNKPKKDPTNPVEPCPKRLEWIRLVSLEYLSDHRLIKDEEDHWTNTGALYPLPHWKEGMDEAHPITHNMNRKVTLQLVFEAGPEGACPESGDILGIGDKGLSFSGEATFSPGTLSIQLTSKGKLPKLVTDHYLFIDWSVKTPPVSYSVTTGGWCYLTMDDPKVEGEREDGVTRKRIAKAVELVGYAGSLRPHTIVEYLMEMFSFYTLQRDPLIPTVFRHPSFFNDIGGAWAMADYSDLSGECQAIVRFVRGVLHQVGCPGTAQPVVVWADPDIRNGRRVLVKEGTPITLHNHRKTVNGVTWYVSLADRDPVSVGTVFKYDDIGMNTYEACLRFTHGGVTKYYGGGADTFDSPEEVITAFFALVWYSIEYVGNVMHFKIQEIVRRYR
ncbi:MAG: hypothetical protein JNK48_27260 [Bryobacterales bacterium]|nr:hypothetical protein [Bryobacterales bacterium]